MSFGIKLREIRKKKRLTRGQLEERAGLGRFAIRDYEQGRREPSLDAAFRIAEALGVRVERFKCEKG